MIIQNNEAISEKLQFFIVWVDGILYFLIKIRSPKHYGRLTLLRYQQLHNAQWVHLHHLFAFGGLKYLLLTVNSCDIKKRQGVERVESKVGERSTGDDDVWHEEKIADRVANKVSVSLINRTKFSAYLYSCLCFMRLFISLYKVWYLWRMEASRHLSAFSYPSIQLLFRISFWNSVLAVLLERLSLREN